MGINMINFLIRSWSNFREANQDLSPLRLGDKWGKDFSCWYNPWWYFFNFVQNKFIFTYFVLNPAIYRVGNLPLKLGPTHIEQDESRHHFISVEVVWNYTILFKWTLVNLNYNFIGSHHLNFHDYLKGYRERLDWIYLFSSFCINFNSNMDSYYYKFVVFLKDTE